MLTKSDLSEIRKIIRTEIETSQDGFQSELKLVRMRIENKLSILEGKIKNIDIKVNNIDKSIHVIEKEIRQIKKDIKVIISHFDHEYLALDERVSKIETRIGLAAS